MHTFALYVCQMNLCILNTYLHLKRKYVCMMKLKSYIFALFYTQICACTYIIHNYILNAELERRERRMHVCMKIAIFILLVKSRTYRQKKHITIN